MDSKENILLEGQSTEIFNPPTFYYKKNYSYSLDNFVFKLVSSVKEKEIFNEFVYNNFQGQGCDYLVLHLIIKKLQINFVALFYLGQTKGQTISEIKLFQANEMAFINL